MKLNKLQADVLEIANELIRTLSTGSSMPSYKADEIVKQQAERLITQIVGIKGSVRKLGYGCIQFKDGASKGGADYKFIED